MAQSLFDSTPDAESMALAHHCKCTQVTRCSIYNHPSAKVQAALNNLMDVMADYDGDIGNSSYLLFTSRHETGIFTSETYKA